MVGTVAQLREVHAHLVTWDASAEAIAHLNARP